MRTDHPIRIAALPEHERTGGDRPQPITFLCSRTFCALSAENPERPCCGEVCGIDAGEDD